MGQFHTALDGTQRMGRAAYSGTGGQREQCSRRPPTCAHLRRRLPSAAEGCSEGSVEAGMLGETDGQRGCGCVKGPAAMGCPGQPGVPQSPHAFPVGPAPLLSVHRESPNSGGTCPSPGPIPAIPTGEPSPNLAIEANGQLGMRIPGQERGRKTRQQG
eukprot:scaffold12020_cov122-Isochrysis_galbana.AAC.14